MSTDHRADMKYQIHSVAVSTIVTEVRTIRLEVTDPEVYTDINGKQWLPATAYLEYRRTNGGPWKIHKSIARGTSIKRDGSRGAQNFKEARIDSDAGRDRDDATKYGPGMQSWGVLEDAILSNWPTEQLYAVLPGEGAKATTWTFYWRDGKREVLAGETAADALNRAGYGRDALGALDFHAAGDRDDYVWDPSARTWNETEAEKTDA